MDAVNGDVISKGAITAGSMDELLLFIDKLSRQIEGTEQWAKPVKGINYARANPLFNIFVPGIAQFQAGDVDAGAAFFGCWLFSAGLLSASEIAFSYYFNSYEQASSPNLINYYYSQSQIFRNISIGALAIYGLSVGLSMIHAYSQPKELVWNNIPEMPVQLCLTKKEFRVSFSGKF